MTTKMTLENILQNYYTHELSLVAAKTTILDVMKGLLPEELSESGSLVAVGWNECREEILKNIERLR